MNDSIFTENSNKSNRISKHLTPIFIICIKICILKLNLRNNRPLRKIFVFYGVDFNIRHPLQSSEFLNFKQMIIGIIASVMHRPCDFAGYLIDRR